MQVNVIIVSKHSPNNTCALLRNAITIPEHMDKALLPATMSMCKRAMKPIIKMSRSKIMTILFKLLVIKYVISSIILY
jgi:hypothetical protein